MTQTPAAKQVNADINRLNNLLRKRIQQRVLGHLKSIREPVTSGQIARALGLTVSTARLVLLDLHLAGRIAQVGQDAAGALTFRSHEIGRCEWCGVVSHYLIAGECPEHRVPTR